MTNLDVLKHGLYWCTADYGKRPPKNKTNWGLIIFLIILMWFLMR